MRSTGGRPLRLCDTDVDAVPEAVYEYAVAVDGLGVRVSASMLAPIHARSSSPSPTSMRSGAGNWGLAGSDFGGPSLSLSLSLSLLRALSEPIERRPLSFFVDPDDACLSFSFSGGGGGGDGVPDVPFSRSRIPRDVFLFATYTPCSLTDAPPPYPCPCCDAERPLSPSVLRLSKRPSKSFRSSYSLNVLFDPMLGARGEPLRTDTPHLRLS